MKEHLSDEQFAGAVMYESDETSRMHSGDCAACREEVQLFRSALGVWVEEIVAAAEPPESFWQVQRDAIGTRLTEGVAHHPWRRLLWATAVVTLVLLSTTLLSRRPAPSPQKTQADTDSALLFDVQDAVRRDLPRALQPATLLTQEMDRAEEGLPNHME